MKLSIIRALLFVLFGVLFLYVAGLSKHEAVTLSLALTYVTDPLVTSLLTR